MLLCLHCIQKTQSTGWPQADTPVDQVAQLCNMMSGLAQHGKVECPWKLTGTKERWIQKHKKSFLWCIKDDNREGRSATGLVLVMHCTHIELGMSTWHVFCIGPQANRRETGTNTGQECTKEIV